MYNYIAFVQINLSFKKKALPKKHVFFGKKKIKFDSHRDHRAHRGKILGGKNTVFIYRIKKRI